MSLSRSRLLLIIGALIALAPLRAAAAPIRPIEVRVVIVATWEDEAGGKDVTGELHAWRTKWPLTVQMPFPAGVHPLLYDPRRHVLAVVTGMATARAAASITALGLDPRFDLSHAYWIVAGTAGVDPKAASAGSVAWSRWVIDGDLAQELDPRDAPPDWPTGIVPYGRTTPYAPPAPPGQSETADVAFQLNTGLVAWAFERTRDTKLPDDALLQKLRRPYAGPGAQPPFVLEGEGLMSARNWYGQHLNDWAERWVDYWTGGKGLFAMSAEEDSGILEAVKLLRRAGRARLDRVLVLRAASDYTVGPPDMTAAQFLAQETHEGFPATPEALDGLYAVAAPVVRYLADHWAETRDRVPTAAP
ncbi:MAG TPA: purine nucleoside permease [Caulobacteraceae bacterium]|nr:purine nucleoside permease [Caulobacteraceae bacterium]